VTRQPQARCTAPARGDKSATTWLLPAVTKESTWPDDHTEAKTLPNNAKTLQSDQCGRQFSSSSMRVSTVVTPTSDLTIGCPSTPLACDTRWSVRCCAAIRLSQEGAHIAPRLRNCAAIQRCPGSHTVLLSSAGTKSLLLLTGYSRLHPSDSECLCGLCYRLCPVASVLTELVELNLTSWQVLFMYRSQNSDTFTDATATARYA
jgi:hypothetical protein